MTTSPGAAARSIGSLVRRLADPREVADAYGRGLVEEARQRGLSSWSPPQAHLVAGAVSYDQGRISLASAAQAGNGTAGELLGGAEYGSDVYRQFGPHSSRGHWLWPTLLEPPPDVTDLADHALDDLIEDAI